MIISVASLEASRASGAVAAQWLVCSSFVCFEGCAGQSAFWLLQALAATYAGAPWHHGHVTIMRPGGAVPCQTSNTVPAAGAVWLMVMFRNLINRWFFLSYLTSTLAVTGTSDVQILNTLVTLV
jgi:hypothetical protein